MLVKIIDFFKILLTLRKIDDIINELVPQENSN